MSTACGISAVIPTWRRPESLRRALEKCLACDPQPDEVLVHIDAHDDETAPMLEREFAGRARWVASLSTQGPGGGRNRLIREARHPAVASFDDDSWALDWDFFGVAAEVFSAHPAAAVLVGVEVRPGLEPQAREAAICETASFIGGACLLRRAAFLSTRGYVPLRYAYGLEETDMALQLLDAGWRILRVPALRVYHDSQTDHQNNAAVNAAHIRNTALLAFLRYPIRYWPLGVFQVFNRMRYAARLGRWRGMAAGFMQVPGAAWRYRSQRRPVRPSTVALSRGIAKG